MTKLRDETTHDEIQFWGKIDGTIKDCYYHVALALDYNGSTLFPTKTFYWCSSWNFNFAELPATNEKTAKSIGDINTLFTGEYDTILAT